MEKVVNLGIPHVAENIFGNLTDDQLLECLKVSKTWESIALEIIALRWRDIFDDLSVPICRGLTNIVQCMLEHPKCANIDWNIMLEVEPVPRFDFKIIFTPFMIACYHGMTDIVKLILSHSHAKRIDLNAKDYLGQTGFNHACFNGHDDIVKMILDQAETLDIDLTKDTTAKLYLKLTYFWPWKPKILRLLLSHPNAKHIHMPAPDHPKMKILLPSQPEDVRKMYMNKFEQK